MSDIAEYMRAGGPCIETNNKCKVMDTASGCACATAADTITTLRADNERLRAALEKIDLLNTPLHGWSMSDLIDQEIVASGIRAALAEEKKDG